jgi:hypothetical protein
VLKVVISPKNAFFLGGGGAKQLPFCCFKWVKGFLIFVFDKTLYPIFFPFVIFLLNVTNHYFFFFLLFFFFEEEEIVTNHYWVHTHVAA